MYNGNFPRLGKVGMGVDVIGRAMRCPTGMADAEAAMEGMVAQGMLQFLDAAHPFDDFEALAVEDRYTARVVTAIFEPAQALQEKGLGVFIPKVSDNSTHRATTLLPRWDASVKADGTTFGAWKRLSGC